MIGDHAHQGIDLALEEVSESSGWINGRPVQVLHPLYPADDPSKLQPIAVRLLAVDRIPALLGGFDLDDAQLLARTAQSYEAALITPVELPVQPLAENLFSINVSLDFEAKTLARFARQELRADRIAIVPDRRPESAALVTALKQELSQQHVTWEDPLSLKTQADLPELIERLKKASVNVVFYCGAAAGLPQIRARLAAAGLKPAVVVAGMGAELELLRTDRSAGQGVYAATPFVAEAADANGQSFAKKYQERFHETADTAAALSYDGLRVLLEALRRAKDASAEKVRAELARGDSAPMESVTGAFSFSAGHVARRPLFVVQIEDGQLVRPKRYDPDPN